MVSSTEVDVPQSWENLFTYLSQRWFDDEDLNEEVTDRLNVTLEKRLSFSEKKKSSLQSQEKSSTES